MVELHPLTGIGEVGPGADLAGLLSEALDRSSIGVRSGDVLAVTQKIVSKAEHRFVRLKDVSPGDEAFRLAEITGKDPRIVEVVLQESLAIVRAVPGLLITRHRLGFVMANAGVDRSNIGRGEQDRLLLLPVDPDKSADALSDALKRSLGFRLPVVITDSFGRPWRNGVIGAAIGVSGLPALLDQRGELDRDGRPLEATQVALADLIASAAGLVSGEGAESIPAVLVRGAPVEGSAGRAADLVRSLSEDLFQ